MHRLLARYLTGSCTAGLRLGLPSLVLLWSGAGFGMQPSHVKPQKPLQWRSAIVQTLDKNPSLIAAGLHLGASAGQVEQARLRTNPELAVGVEDALGSGEFKDWQRGQASLGISWVLDGSLRKYRVATAEVRALAAQDELGVARLDAAANTARLFISVLSLQARRAHSKEAISRAEEIVEQVRLRVAAGKCPAAELALAKVDLSNQLLLQDDIEHELAIARRNLAAQWGEAEPTFTAVAGDIFTLPPAADFNELTQRAKSNPRLKRLATLTRLEASRLTLAQAERKPLWKASLGVKQIAETDDHALMAGVSVPLALYDQNQGRISEAQSNLAASEAEEAAEKVRLDAALFALHQELQHNLHIAQTYTGTILPQLERATAQTQQAYESGLYSYAQWQSVQARLLEAKVVHINTCTAAMLKAVELERLTGVAITPQGQGK